MTVSCMRWNESRNNWSFLRDKSYISTFLTVTEDRADEVVLLGTVVQGYRNGLGLESANPRLRSQWMTMVGQCSNYRDDLVNEVRGKWSDLWASSNEPLWRRGSWRFIKFQPLLIIISFGEQPKEWDSRYKWLNWGFSWWWLGSMSEPGHIKQIVLLCWCCRYGAQTWSHKFKPTGNLGFDIRWGGALSGGSEVLQSFEQGTSRAPLFEAYPNGKRPQNQGTRPRTH